MSQVIATSKVTPELHFAARVQVAKGNGGEPLSVIRVANGALCADAITIEAAGVGGTIELELYRY